MSIVGRDSPGGSPAGVGGHIRVAPGPGRPRGQVTRAEGPSAPGPLRESSGPHLRRRPPRARSRHLTGPRARGRGCPSDPTVATPPALNPDSGHPATAKPATATRRWPNRGPRPAMCAMDGGRPCGRPPHRPPARVRRVAGHRRRGPSRRGGPRAVATARCHSWPAARPAIGRPSAMTVGHDGHPGTWPTVPGPVDAVRQSDSGSESVRRNWSLLAPRSSAHRRAIPAVSPRAGFPSTLLTATAWRCAVDVPTG